MEECRIVLDDTAGRGDIHISGGTYSFRRTGLRHCREDWVPLFSAHLSTEPAVLVYIESQIPAGDPGPAAG